MKRTIDRSSTLPLYSQIKAILLTELQDVEASGVPVLTEASLMKRFQVSRAPIRQALKELVDEGYIVRQRAKGTFPAQGLNVRLPPALELGGLSRYLREQGLTPTSKVLDLVRVSAPAEVCQDLGLDPASEVLRLQRIIFVESAPLVWTSSYLCTPAEFMPSVEDLERTGTVFTLIEQKYGLTFTRGEQSIWAAGASREEAAALQVGEGSPVLVTVTTMYTNDGRPGGWRRAVHRAEDFKYVFGLNR